jgi:hypothetical protein
MCLCWAGFPIFTAPIRGSCITSAVLISAVRAISDCISFMLPVVLFPGMPVRDGASSGAGADPTVFYIADYMKIYNICKLILNHHTRDIV